ncbi:MAG: type II toxin-antitoxin system VapC family toxin [Desulfobacteraceae bacterium]|nr:MAG: type II toxin-antitoxin system VapC family toxin [Desulfobacteraceae bacterium]
MIIGLDTGYFIALMRNTSAALEHWNSLKGQEHTVIVSVLTLGEMLYISFRTGEVEHGETLVELIAKTTTIIDVDQRIVEKAARLKAGRGMPYTDALILAAFLENDCEEIHTTDRAHFGDINNQGMNVIFW